MPEPSLSDVRVPADLVVQPSPMLGHHVTASLRRMIITGELAAETHLVEAQLSTMFDVSRGPIRDALRQLEREGLVESRRRGVFVLGLTSADIQELYDLREAIETKVMAICHAADHLDVEEFAPHLEVMRRAAEASDSNAFSEADLAFHSTFYALAGNRRVLDVWNQYRPTYEMMMTVANVEPVDLGPIFASHERLLELTLTGDLEELTELLHVHLERSKERLMVGHSKLTTHT